MDEFKVLFIKMSLFPFLSVNFFNHADPFGLQIFSNIMPVGSLISAGLFKVTVFAAVVNLHLTSKAQEMHVCRPVIQSMIQK